MAKYDRSRSVQTRKAESGLGQINYQNLDIHINSNSSTYARSNSSGLVLWQFID